MIVRKTIGEQIFDYIINEIRIGNLKPGDRLKDERSLAEELGVSRVPIREAVRSLCQMGILNSRQGEGTYVNTNSSDVLKNAMNLYMLLDQTIMLEFIEVRRFMETESARLASLNATDEEIKEITSIAKQREAAADEDMDEEKKHELLDELDRKFHLTVAKATHNSVFYNFLDSIRTTLKIHQQEAAKQPGMMKKTNTLHRKVCEAIARRDSKEAAALMQQHLMDVERVLIKTFNEWKEK